MPKKPHGPDASPAGEAARPATPDDQKRRFGELIERLEGDVARSDNVIPLNRKKPKAKKPC